MIKGEVTIPLFARQQPYGRELCFLAEIHVQCLRQVYSKRCRSENCHSVYFVKNYKTSVGTHRTKCYI